MNKYLNANAVISKVARDYIDLKRELPIRPSEMGVLSIVSGCDKDFTPLTLAETIGVSKPMIAAHLRTLLKKGYICKECSGVDKRSFFVHPTEKGRALAAAFEAERIERLKSMEKRLGEGEFDELIRLLGKAQVILAELSSR